MRKKVLVLGGNFGGLTAALSVKHELQGDVDVTVVSSSDRFLFNPSLIWLPFGKRRPDDITFPLEPTFESHQVDFVHATATRIDPAPRVVSTVRAAGSMRVAVACTKSTWWDSKVGSSGKVMSSGRRLPNGSQISEGLNRNRSEEDTTVTSTSPWSSCLTLSAAVRPPKLPPRTSTFLRIATTSSPDPALCAQAGTGHRTRVRTKVPGR